MDPSSDVMDWLQKEKGVKVCKEWIEACVQWIEKEVSVNRAES